MMVGLYAAFCCARERPRPRPITVGVLACDAGAGLPKGRLPGPRHIVGVVASFVIAGCSPRVPACS